LLTSHRRIGPIPQTPAQTFSHISSADSPSEVTTPNPVTTTRRFDIVWMRLNCESAASPSGGRHDSIRSSYLLEWPLM
jgi:hypothetical protein